MGQKKLSGKTIYHACSSNTVNRIYRPVTKFLHATNCIYIKDHLSRRKIEQHLAMHTTIGSLRKILHTNHVIITHCMSSLDRQVTRMKRVIAPLASQTKLAVSRNGTRRVAPEFVAPVLSCVPLLYYLAHRPQPPPTAGRRSSALQPSSQSCRSLTPPVDHRTAPRRVHPPAEWARGPIYPAHATPSRLN
jgi:hypothetical protein